jgi:hypothetical protein
MEEGMTNTFKAKVERFERENGRHYVAVPTELSKPHDHPADRGLIAVMTTAGNSSRPTSLLPMGDGTHFIALPAKVRTKENCRVAMKPKFHWLCGRGN